jgi:hypothetical protein
MDGRHIEKETMSTSVIIDDSRLSQRRRTQQWLIVIGAGVLGLGMSLWQLSVPEQLSFYNSGVYFAASFKLVTGVMPYRDFVFVQPPGILLALSPATLLARIVGTHDGFIVARVMSGIVVGLNASLLALLLRRRGRVAMIIAGFGLSLLPVAFWVSSAVMLEPYCIVFVLLGALALLGSDEGLVPSRRRAIIAGALFGVATLMKLWAILPFIAILLCLLPRNRRRILNTLTSAGSTFIIVALPFFVSAPRNFISQVFVEQLGRSSNSSNDVTILNRLVNLTGFATTRIVPSAGESLAVFMVLFVIVIAAFVRRRFDDVRDIFLVVSALLIVVALLIAPEFYSYYAYFAAPFLMGLFAACLSRIAPLLRPCFARLQVRAHIRRLVGFSSAVTGALALFGAVLWVTSQFSAYAFGYGIYTPWLNAIDHHVPSGSCVVYSDVSFGVVTNRLATSDPRCPNVVDPDGMLVSYDDRGHAPQSLVTQWRSYFSSSPYVVLLYPRVPRIPWDSSLDSWFAHHFHLVYEKNYVYIYRSTSHSPS